jgi:peptidoglycan/LPS O-acetylase OafA/YrhL
MKKIGIYVLGLLAFGILALGHVGVLPSIVDLRTLVSMITVGLISSLLYHPNALLYKWILGNKPIVFIGKISYGVYLFHNAIGQIIAQYLPQLMGWTAWIFQLLCTLLLAALVHLTVETPARKIGRQLARRLHSRC